MKLQETIRRILREEVAEYARTLKNARKQGSGLRFPKSAVKANPNRFRPYSREQVDETTKDKKIICQCGWSWKLKDGGNNPYTCHKCGHVNSKKNIKEETKKDLSPILTNLLNKLLVKHHKDILCGVKVVHPSDRESVGIKHKNYEVILFFFGDEEEEMTYKERQKYNKLEDEAFDLVYKYTNQYADVYSKFLKSCDE